MQKRSQHYGEKNGGADQMIIKKKVASICKKNKSMLLATSADNTQWVGQGSAFYSIAGLPQMTVPEVMNALDYTDDEKAKFTEMAKTFPTLIRRKYWLTKSRRFIITPLSM